MIERILTMRIFFVLCLACSAWSQSITETIKAQWLARNGMYLNNIRNDASIAFAMLESGRVDSSWMNAYVDTLLKDESWWSGNRGAGLLALQLCLWEKSKLPAAAYQKLWQRLNDLCADDHYWAQAWNNGQINCMVVHYTMAQFNRTATVRYGYILDSTFAGNFSFGSNTYQHGKIYSVYELCRDWLYAWMGRYISGGYIHGELFSEVYGHHYLNALITLADQRNTFDSTMRVRAAMTADFFLLEHGINMNGHHLAGPLGRTYMQSHLQGRDFFFPWEVYFGTPHPTHYGHSGSFYVSSYRPPPEFESLVQNSLPRVITSSVQDGRYVVVTDRYTLGSSPHNGNWLLEINSNDAGPFPQARPGFNFRLWLNNKADDLNPSTCDGECYAEMGQNARQYKNSLLIAMPGVFLHEALASNTWDSITNISGWRFSVENDVAVAIRIEADAAAVEVSRLGVDESDLDTFVAAVIANSRIVSMNEYITRRREKIEIQNNKMFVDGRAFNHNLPRLSSIDADGNELISSLSGSAFRVGEIEFDFSNWASPALVVDTPPTPPQNVAIQ
jgi:hypothetical protein